MLVIRHDRGEDFWYVGYLEPETENAQEVFTEVSKFRDRISAVRLVNFLNGGTAGLGQSAFDDEELREIVEGA